MLKLSAVHTYYGESYVLQGVSMDVAPGMTVALLGRNGMGKTTTINSIIGFTPARRGNILFKGKDIAWLPSHQIARMGIGLVPQGRHIFQSLSVLENLTIGARRARKGEGWGLDEIYSLFPILKERGAVRGTFLSGGEQQMLTIGRALMTNPDLLLMDEPSEGLAPLMVREMKGIIGRLKGWGFSILLVEQNLPMVLGISDYIYILSKGIIVHACTPGELKTDQETAQKFLGASK
jgi:branched-chain amino acid transport system ATP-binding protein